MPDDLRHLIEHLRDDLRALVDRVNDLEHSHMAMRRRVPVPLKIPTRTATKISLAVSAFLTVMALALVLSPQTVMVGGVLYNWPGISAEALAKVAASVGVGVTIREHLKDKSDFKDKDD